MFTDIYTPVDEDCENSLIKIQNVLNSDCFLAGLGKVSHEHPIPAGFNVITEFERCIYLLNSQDMWGMLDDERKGDQNFAEALDDAVDYLGYPTYDDPEANRRMKKLKGAENFRQANQYLSDITADAYSRNGILEFLLSNFQNVTSDVVNEFWEYDINGNIEKCFDLILRAAYFGGLKKWPICDKLLECFAIGGFPTGWVGPLARDGGESEKCMQVLHFGPEAK